MKWRRSCGKWNEPPPTTPKAGLHPKSDAVYMVGLEWSPLLSASYGNPTVSSKFYSQLDQLKAALDKKHPELVNRKCIIFHQDNTKPYVSLMIRQKMLQLGGKFWFIHRVHSTLCLQMSIYFDLYKILLMERL